MLRYEMGGIFRLRQTKQGKYICHFYNLSTPKLCTPCMVSSNYRTRFAYHLGTVPKSGKWPCSPSYKETPMIRSQMNLVYRISVIIVLKNKKIIYHVSEYHLHSLTLLNPVSVISDSHYLVYFRSCKHLTNENE